MKNYLTKSGDTWDKIAYEQLGSEYLLPLLLESNPKHRTIVRFNAGISVVIPEVEQSTVDDRPEWLRDEGDE
jgi:hypothetical protein